MTTSQPGHEPAEGTSRRVVLGALAVAAVLDVAYWALWFTARDQVASETRDAYVEFEQAFPLADLWLLVCVVAAFITLVRRSHWSLFWLLAGGGAGIYLACMDTLYDLEHGIWGMGANGITELAIVAYTVTLGVGLLRWGWRRRHTLLAAR
jgi:hypothetical protein